MGKTSWNGFPRDVTTVSGGVQGVHIPGYGTQCQGAADRVVLEDWT